MNDPARKAKDKATQLIAKGKFEPALKELRAALEIVPHDVPTRQKIAETLGRLGRNAEAIREYQHVVGRYAADGHLLKAVAICKVILQLDPAHKETQRALADLYAKRRGDDTFTASIPASMAAEMPSTLHAIDLPAADEQGMELLVVPTRHFDAPLPSAGGKPGRPQLEIVERPTLEIVDEEPIEVSADDLVVDVVEEEEVVEGMVVEDEPSQSISVEGDVMPHIPLFSDLGRSAFAAVLENVEIESFEPGQPIVHEGERDRRMFAIVQGEVSVQRAAGSGPAREVARMREGDFFGEIAMVADTPRLASVAAATQTVLMIFTREAMDDIVHSHPSVGKVIERFYRERLLANVLRSNALFKPLATEAKDKLTSAFRMRTAPKGAALLEQGEAPDGFYLLLRGRCEVLDKRRGKERHYPSLGEGAVFGEVSLMLDQPVTATVRAATDVVLLRLSRPAFTELVLANPEVRKMITRLSVERLTRTKELLAEDGPAEDFRV